MIKNNVTRMLDSHRIRYTSYQMPPRKFNARETADFLGVPVTKVYKTIVLLRRGQGKPILAVTPGDAEVDTKAVARALAEKKVSVASLREAEQLTGLQAGGISPLALINRGFQVVVDRSAITQGDIHISGGELGLNVCLPACDLIKLTGAQVADICTK